MFVIFSIIFFWDDMICLLLQFFCVLCMTLFWDFVFYTLLQVKKALRGVKVIATHGNFPRQYRISGITQQPTNQLR